MWNIVIVLYTAWAFYSGFKFLSQRSEWLDRRKPLNVICKLALSVLVGYVIGGFYLIYLILKFMGLMSKW